MAGFLPDEGETVITQVIHQRTHADRPANLELGLFTDAAPGETITEATIAEPTGGGYARKTLTDASWSISGNPADATYAQQTFSPSAGDYSGTTGGYFVASTTGGTQRILFMEIDSSGPYTLTDGDTYDIDLSNTVDQA